MCAVGLVLRIVYSCELLNLILWVVGNNNLYWVEDCADADGAGVKIIANGTLEKGHVVKGINLGITNLIDELDDTFWAVTTTAETADSRHAGIVPTAYHTVLYQCQQITL